VTATREVKGDSHQIWRIWRTQRVQVNVASLRLFLRSSTGPNRAFEPQSLGRVRHPVRIAEGPTAIDAATQRRHFGFRLRLVDKLQPKEEGCQTWFLVFFGPSLQCALLEVKGWRTATGTQLVLTEPRN